MFVGSVDWLLNSATELYGVRVTIFDCTKEDVVFDSNNHPDEDIVMEVNYQGFGDYDVCSYDLYLDPQENKICMEINIEMEEEEDL